MYNVFLWGYLNMEISVSKGQGITQAIASNLGLNKDDCKNVKLETWQSIMTLVDEANTKRLENNESSIFTGGNDVSSIGDKSSWHSNFHVNEGDVMQIEDSVFDKIKKLLGIQAQEETEETEETEGEEKVQEEKTGEETPVEETEENAEVELSEEAKKGEAIDKKFKEMGEFDESGKVKDISLNLVDDEWRKLAGKKDKTEAEKQQLDTQYKTAVKNLGCQYTAFIDAKYGNGDGVVDKDEYFAFEEAAVPQELKDDEASKADIEEMKEIGFNRLDLNKDGKIDNEELAAYIHAMDFGTEDGKSNGLNGKISAFDYLTNSLALSKKEKSSLDEKLA